MPICLPEDYDYYKIYLQDPSFIEWCKNIGVNDSDTIYGLTPFYDKYCKDQIKKNKPKPERNIKFCFITIQDFQRRLHDLDKLQQFIKNIDYLYHEGSWIIEAGKSDPPNVHLHFLVKIINPKKHKSKLNIEWKKLFNTDLYDKDFYKLTQHRDTKGMPKYEQWCQEKLDYFDNSTKGTHSNSIDLNLKGSFGGEG